MRQPISVAEYKTSLSKEPKPRRQLEKKLQMDFGKILFGFEQYKKFSPDLIKYSYIANGELRPATIDKKGKRYSRVGTELKIKGVRKGIFDYYFCVKRICTFGGIDVEIGFDIWLEAKAPDGVMTKEQKEFKKKAEGVVNIKIYEFKSVHEGVRFLEMWGIVLK